VIEDAQLILVAGGLLVAAVLVSVVADRLRLPALVLFLVLGMVIGSDGIGWIDFGGDPGDYEFTRLIGSIAVALILFEGGLATGFQQIRPVLRPAIALATLGTVGTAAVAGVAAMLLFDFSPLQGLLVGAIVSASDGAAVFAILRRSKLRQRLACTLEGEAGLNDPVAVLLVLALIELILTPGYDGVDAVLFFVQELGIGILVGVGVGWLAAKGLQRFGALLPQGLVLVASFAAAALAFGLAGALHGSGFMAVYLAGLAVGSVKLADRPSLLAFHDGLGSVAEIGLFLVLGLLVDPGQLTSIVVEAAVLALVLAFVARPLAAMLATALGRFDVRERLALGWAGLRGGVPVVLATFPVIAGVPRSVEFFNIVFFAVLVSTVVQGTTLEALARRLGVVESSPR